ncbi:MAG TPA: dihydroorotate dehydrogenase [Actinomycetota bacterium]|jgi:dihydroorotate dehydrogenase (NAD+) catalytic subunit|nr:dihydroorotate dehydrogenase [Actinomycetota bacterium]
MRPVSEMSVPAGLEPKLAVDLGEGIRLPNPCLAASGCYHYGREFEPYVDLSELGGIIVKSLSVRPWPGHPPPRGAETPSGMLNAIGLQNPGVEAFAERELPWLVKHRVPVFASIVGNTVEEFIRVAERLRGAPGIVGIEVNISCPNLEDRSRMFSSREETTAAVIRGVKRVATQPVFTKLSPDVTDIVAIARAAIDAGTYGLSVMNTTLGMAIDVEEFKPKLSTLTGGLSGPAVKPIAIRCVFQVSQAFPDVPLIGQGGIRTGADVAEFMLAGASAVAIGTANFVEPAAMRRIIGELRSYLQRKQIRDVNALRTMLRLP